MIVLETGSRELGTKAALRERENSSNLSKVDPLTAR